MEFLKHLKNEWDSEVIRKAYLSCGLTEFHLPQRSKSKVGGDTEWMKK